MESFFEHGLGAAHRLCRKVSFLWKNGSIGKQAATGAPVIVPGYRMAVEAYCSYEAGRASKLRWYHEADSLSSL